MNLILVLHFLSCGFLTGVIWLVQVLVYPNFRLIKGEDFNQFHQFHTRRITWVVAPAMLVELITGGWLFLTETDRFYFWNLMSILALWILTQFVSVPIHNLISRSLESESLKNRLIWTNWPRTLLWTVRSLCLISIIKP